MQADVNTCHVPCAERNGAGYADSRGAITTRPYASLSESARTEGGQTARSGAPPQSRSVSRWGCVPEPQH